uniref:Reverse transcriptase domain-containing protein n=1 Tax=Oryzias latipes TaxID=8090 RepID=A0A3P9HQC6_ORYLA
LFFHLGHSTIDHLQSVVQILEKTNEYKKPIYMAFVDYEKAFDFILHKAVFEALKQQIHGDSRLTSSVSLSIIIANRKGLRADP